jgi:MFS family permease
MFLLPSLLLGIVFALLLGGRPSRILEIEFHQRWTVPAALAVQLTLFSPLGAHIPDGVASSVHLASYGLLFLFGAANVRILPLLPLLAGMALNAVAILANGGKMPVSPSAWRAAGLPDEAFSNVRRGAEHLGFLGDIFALPAGVPLANVFSFGDLLIGFGMAAFVVVVSTSEGQTRVLVPARLLRPLAHSSFRRLAAGKLVSQLGDWLTLAALVGWIYDETGSTGQVAALMLVRLAPPIIGGSLAAAVVDRFPKERLLVGVELGRGVVVVGALAAVAVDYRPLAFAAVGISAVLAAVGAATVPALVPALLGRELLPAANAGLGIAQDGAMALGALGAGLALSVSGAVVALAIDLVTFVAAAGLYSTVRVPHGSTPAHEEAAEDAGGGVRDGFRYLLSRPLLLVVICAFGTATIATGLTNATLPRLLEDLGLGPGAYGYGLAALAAGLAVGQGFVGFTRAGPGAGRWIGAGLVVMAAFFVALSLTAHAPTAILLLGLIGIVDGTTDVLFATVVQREAHPRFYGRVFGFASAFMAMTMMGAVVIAPIVNRIAPPGEVILVAGLTLLGAAAITLVGTRAHGVQGGDEATAGAPLTGELAFAPAPPSTRDP